MAQSEFTKEEAERTLEAIDEIFTALPKSRKMNYIGHLNDVCLFVQAAKEAAPKENT